MADPLTLECGHPRVLRWADESGEVRLWACEDCRRRFYPACPECVDVGHRDETHPDAARAVPAGLDVERLARAMARFDGGDNHTPEDAEDHWPSYLDDARRLAREYAAIKGNQP